MLVTLFRFTYNTTADMVLSFNNPVQSADHHLLNDTGLTEKKVCAHYYIYMCFSFSTHWVYFITANVELDFVQLKCVWVRFGFVIHTLICFYSKLITDCLEVAVRRQALTVSSAAIRIVFCYIQLLLKESIVVLLILVIPLELKRKLSFIISVIALNSSENISQQN